MNLEHVTMDRGTTRHSCSNLRAERRCSAAESGTLRVALDAVRNSYSQTSRTDGALPGQCVDTSPDYKKLSAQDYDNARVAIKNVAEKFSTCSQFTKKARATGEKLSEKRLRGIRILLQRKHEYVCEGTLELQWQALRAIYTCNFDILEGLLSRIRTNYASNFSLFSLIFRR